MILKASTTVKCHKDDIGLSEFAICFGQEL